MAHLDGRGQASVNEGMASIFDGIAATKTALFMALSKLSPQPPSSEHTSTLK